MAFPVVLSRATTPEPLFSGTSFSVSLPGDIVEGDLIVVLVSTYNAPTVTVNTSVSGNNWNILGSAAYGTYTRGAVLWKIAEPSNALTVNFSSPVRSTAIALRVAGFDAEAPIYGSSSTGSSANSDPPNLSPAPGAKDYLWIATRSCRGIFEASAPPSTPGQFENHVSNSCYSTFGACSDTAEYYANAASVDPGPFTSSSTSWVCWTLAIAPASGLVGTFSSTIEDIQISADAVVEEGIPPAVATFSNEVSSLELSSGVVAATAASFSKSVGDLAYDVAVNISTAATFSVDVNSFVCVADSSVAVEALLNKEIDGFLLDTTPVVSVGLLDQLVGTVEFTSSSAVAVFAAQNQSIQDIVIGSSAASAVQAASSLTLDSISLVSNTSSIATLSASVALGDFETSAIATVLVSASAVQTVDNVVSSISASALVVAATSQAVQTVAVSADAFASLSLSCIQTIEPIAIVSDASISNDALLSLSLTIDNITVAASSRAQVKASVTQSLGTIGTDINTNVGVVSHIEATISDFVFDISASADLAPTLSTSVGDIELISDVASTTGSLLDSDLGILLLGSESNVFVECAAASVFDDFLSVFRVYPHPFRGFCTDAQLQAHKTATSASALNRVVSSGLSVQSQTAKVDIRSIAQPPKTEVVAYTQTAKVGVSAPTQRSGVH